jgi:uncharacterized protein (TIGR00369 family)
MGAPLYRTEYCFGCGTNNPEGLNLAPVNEGGRIVARFTPRDAHRGYAKAVHGGITCCLLDEITGLACSQKVDGKCVSVELTVEFKRPLIVGVPLTIESRYVRKQGRYLLGAGKITDPEGRVLATARGKFLQLDPEKVKKFIEMVK